MAVIKKFKNGLIWEPIQQEKHGIDFRCELSVFRSVYSIKKGTHTDTLLRLIARFRNMVKGKMTYLLLSDLQKLAIRELTDTSEEAQHFIKLVADIEKNLEDAEGYFLTEESTEDHFDPIGDHIEKSIEKSIENSIRKSMGLDEE